MISDGLSDDIPQLKTLNMVIPIPMYFCCFSLKLYSVVSRIKLRVIQRNVVYIVCMASNYFRQMFDINQSDVALQKQVH